MSHYFLKIYNNLYYPRKGFKSYLIITFNNSYIYFIKEFKLFLKKLCKKKLFFWLKKLIQPKLYICWDAKRPSDCLALFQDSLNLSWPTHIWSWRLEKKRIFRIFFKIRNFRPSAWQKYCKSCKQYVS